MFGFMDVLVGVLVVASTVLVRAGITFRGLLHVDLVAHEDACEGCCRRSSRRDLYVDAENYSTYKSRLVRQTGRLRRG